jgi:chromosome segregation ATPase
LVTRARQPERESTPEWLESQLRETKARLHRVEGELSQALKHFWSLDAGVKKMREAASASAPAAGVLQGFREEVRQFRDQVSRIQDRQAALTTRLDEVARRQQTETGRDRPELGLLTKQVEAVSRAVEQQDARTKALEEMARRVEEDVSGERLTRQGLERTLAEISTRLERIHENVLRVDQQSNSSAAGLEKLRTDDQALAERLKLVAEQARRTAERIDKMENIIGLPDEIRDVLKSETFEREQMLRRLSAVEELAAEMSERMQEFVQGIARLDQRGKQQAGQLLSVGTQLQDLHEQINGALKRVYQVLLRQRRRRAEALAAEIKELSQGELHSAD